MCLEAISKSLCKPILGHFAKPPRPEAKPYFLNKLVGHYTRKNLSAPLGSLNWKLIGLLKTL